MVELLAPAGTADAFKAAVEAGADAIYMAGKKFGARAYADNFGQDDLKEAVRFAHLHGTLVHVTVNTLVDDSEIPALLSYLQELYLAGVDAIIVQDLGVAALARQYVPNLPLHASTQLSTNSLEGARFLQEYGFSRVVLARETSLENIRYICQNTDIEIEVFVHGAICVCYSGQCLMSSLIGGRSGNRGRCAQPCRLPYTLINESKKPLLEANSAGEYLLSPRDMKTIELLPELIKAGVNSFKIEGRMKKPEYVAIVVNSYRKAIDAFYQNHLPPAEAEKELAQIFNRDFTTAYLLKKQGKLMISDRRPNNRGTLLGRVQKYDKKRGLAHLKLAEPLRCGDKIDFWVKVGGRVTTDIVNIFVDGKTVKEAPTGQVVAIKTPPVSEHDRAFKIQDSALNEKAEGFFHSREERRPCDITFFFTAKRNEQAILTATTEDGLTETVRSDYIVTAAKKTPTDEVLLQKQLARLGNTVYRLTRLECDIDTGIIVPTSVLNDLRRKCTDALDQKRLARFTRPSLEKRLFDLPDVLPEKNAKKKLMPLLNVFTTSLGQVRAALEGGADSITFGGDTYGHRAISLAEYEKACALCQNRGMPICLSTPRILRQEQLCYLEKLLKDTAYLPFDAIYVHNPSTFFQTELTLKELGKKLPLRGDFSLNVFNTPTIMALQKRGLSSLTLSPELNAGQIKHLSRYAKLPLEVIIHGQLELMVSEYCVLGSFLGHLDQGTCSAPCTKKHYFLRDRKGEMMPIATDPFCHMHILNSHELSLLSSDISLCKLGTQILRIDGRYIEENRLKKITSAYQALLNGGPADKNDKNILALEGKNFTRGHFFRGVLNPDGEKDGKN